jgi:hypothetical protein
VSQLKIFNVSIAMMRAQKKVTPTLPTRELVQENNFARPPSNVIIRESG